MEHSEERLVMGHIAGAFGVRGWVRVRSHTDPCGNLLSYQPWYIAGEVLRADQHRIQGDHLLVHLEGCDDRDAALSLRNTAILVERQALPALAEGEYYWRDLQGLEVWSEAPPQPVLLGVVRELMATGTNDVLVVAPCAGSRDERERLIPFLMDQVVVAVEASAGRLRVRWDVDF